VTLFFGCASGRLACTCRLASCFLASGVDFFSRTTAALGFVVTFGLTLGVAEIVNTLRVFRVLAGWTGSGAGTGRDGPLSGDRFRDVVSDRDLGGNEFAPLFEGLVACRAIVARRTGSRATV
jgi:hypothetical protein